MSHFKLDTGRWIALSACLIVALYFYSSCAYALLNFDRYASALPQFLRYVAVPGLIAIFFTAAGFYLRRRTAMLVGIYSLAILMGFFLFEALLTYRSLSVHYSNLGILDEVDGDGSDNQAMVRGFTLRALNIRAGLDQLPEIKLSGFPGSDVLLCAPDGEMITYKADRLGFNNPDTVYNSAIDLLVLGDSFVEGFCLPQGDDLVSQLRVGNLNAVSAGIRGNGPLIELAALGRFGPMLKPRHVFMVFFEGNDWKNLGFELSQPWLNIALEPDADFGPVNSPEKSVERSMQVIAEIGNKPASAWDVITRTSIVRNFFALQQTALRLGVLYPKVPPEIPEYETVLGRAKAMAESWGGEFHLVYVPQIGRYVGLAPRDFVFDQLRLKVLNAAKSVDVGVIDLVPLFHAEASASDLYADDSHFSAQGAAHVAKILVDHLSEH